MFVGSSSTGRRSIVRAEQVKGSGMYTGPKRRQIRRMAELLRGAGGERRDPDTVVGEGADPRPWKERELGPGQ